MGKYIDSIYAKNIGKYKEAKVKLNPRYNEIIKTKYLTELDKVEEFRKLQDFLKSNIDN